MSITSFLQDLEISYYWTMSRIVQSQRKTNSTKLTYVTSDSLAESTILEKNQIRILSTQMRQPKYEKKTRGVIA